MNFESIFLWPFFIAFGGAMIVIGLALLAFWIWMIVDCAKRKFNREGEKIAWLIVIVLIHWVGAIVYFIAIKMYNPEGIMEKERKVGRKR